MKIINIVDRVAFFVAVAAGLVAAVAGWKGWQITGAIAGCLAALVPIANRFATNQINSRLLPRTVTSKQRAALIRVLKNGLPFKLWLCHNRHEAEPSVFHSAITEALSAGGIEVQYFGGLNNKTVGVEISGPEGPEKERLFQAFHEAKIPFQPIVLTDASTSGNFGKELAIWIGVNPGMVA